MIETWLLLGLSAVFAIAAFNIYQKHVISDSSPLTLAHQMHGYAVILLAGVLLFVPWQASLSALGLVTVAGVANGMTYWALAAAYEVEDLSVVAPLQAMAPLLIALVEPLFLPLEYNAILLSAGALASLGMYTLLYDGGDLLAPLRRIQSPGVQRGVASAAFLAAAVVIDRYAFVTTDIHVLAFTLYLAFFTFATTTALLLITNRDTLTAASSPSLALLPLGVLRAVILALAMGALSLAAGTRVHVLFQLGPVIAAVVGGSLFAEDNLRRRTLGATVILLAVILVIT